LLTLLDLNGFCLDATNEEFAGIIYNIASGSWGMNADDLYLWVTEHIEK